MINFFWPYMLLFLNSWIFWVALPPPPLLLRPWYLNPSLFLQSPLLFEEISNIIDIFKTMQTEIRVSIDDKDIEYNLHH